MAPLKDICAGALRTEHFGKSSAFAGTSASKILLRSFRADTSEQGVAIPCFSLRTYGTYDHAGAPDAPMKKGK